MKLDNPFLEVKPLQEGFLADVGFPVTGAEFRWNPMVETEAPEDPQQAAAAGSQTGAFYGFYTDTSGGAGDGDIYLQGGTINGVAVATSSMKLYDFGTDSWEGTADQHLYVGVTGAFVVVDSVALPGFTASSVASPAIGTPPSDTFPAVTGATAASNGTCYVSLGVFTASGFLPAASGNRIVGLCITPPYSVSAS